jgi:hypothetical protein
MSVRRTRARQYGQGILYLTLTIVLILGLAGLTIDVGYLYRRRALAQTAADAAALAAALQLPSQTQALATAGEFASLNGYTNGADGATVVGTFNPDGSHPNWYRVRVSRSERLFFTQVFGFRSTRVGATAIAEYTARQPINIWGIGSYGTTGTQSLEISGPYGYYDYGDPYSTKYIGTGTTANSTYDPSGYNYWLNVPSNYSTINGTGTVNLELYDAMPGSSNDENYTGHGVSTQSTTVYSIYRPDMTPNDYTDDIQVGTVTITPSSSTTTYRLKWAVPSGFSFSSATNGTGKYRVNVRTTAGSGGNAFHMRAGPPRGSGVAFNPNNGTVLTSIGRIEQFFLSAATVTWELGYIPSAAAGMVCHIRKFDTDIGATSITYTDTTGLINRPGVLATNGTWREDVFTIPTGYPGGTLRARYSAGRTDTSVWEMWYEGVIVGEPGKVKLVL